MKKILTWVRTKFDQAFALTKRHSAAAVMVTQKLKEIIDSPIADVLTAIIPGEADDAIKEQLRQVLPVVAARVAIAHNIIQASDDPTTALAAIKKYIESLGVEARRDWWILFSAKIAEAFSDGDISYRELIDLTQDAYIEIFKKK